MQGLFNQQPQADKSLILKKNKNNLKTIKKKFHFYFKII